MATDGSTADGQVQHSRSASLPSAWADATAAAAAAGGKHSGSSHRGRADADDSDADEETHFVLPTQDPENTRAGTVEYAQLIKEYGDTNGIGYAELFQDVNMSPHTTVRVADTMAAADGAMAPAALQLNGESAQHVAEHGGILDIKVSAPDQPVTQRGLLQIFDSTIIFFVVDTTMRGDDGSECKFVTHRRFRDLVDLHVLLKWRYRGYFLPGRPAKSWWESKVQLKPDFVQERASSIQRYLVKLSRHPEVGRSEELRVWLTAGSGSSGALNGEASWCALQPHKNGVVDGIAALPQQLLGTNTIPSPSMVEQSAGKNRDFFRMTREFIGGVQSGAAVDGDEAELRNVARTQALRKAALADASRKAEKVVQAFHSTHDAFGELALDMRKLLVHESADLASDNHPGATLARAVLSSAVSHTARHVQLCMHSENMVIKSLAELHDMLNDMPRMLKAMDSRAEAYRTAAGLKAWLDRDTTLLKDLESKHATGKRHSKLLSDVTHLTLTSARADEVYNDVKQHNQIELERHGKRCALSGTNMAASMASIMRIHNAHASDIWRKLAETLNADAADLPPLS